MDPVPNRHPVLHRIPGRRFYRGVRKLRIQRYRSYCEIKNHPYLFPFGLDLAPSRRISLGLPAGHKASSFAALLIYASSKLSIKGHKALSRNFYGDSPARSLRISDEWTRGLTFLYSFTIFPFG